MERLATIFLQPLILCCSVTTSGYSKHRLGQLITALCTVTALGVSAHTCLAQSGREWQMARWELWRMELDDSGLKPLDQTPGCSCGSPIWSPDGQWIAYDVTAYTPDPKPTELPAEANTAIIRADGSDRRLLGPGSIPSWSPDGRLLLFQTDQRVVMNRDGTGREVLPGPANGLRWSPRCNRLATISVTPFGRTLSLFDLTTGEEWPILPGPLYISHGFGISPDGRRICFGSHRSGVWLATLDSGGRQASLRALVESGIGYHASWAPDGRRVVYAWRPSELELTQLYVIDVDSADPPVLLPGLDGTRHNVNPAWSPDGKTIVFSRPASPKE